MSDYLFYFAYGSNLHPQRLKRRAPSSQPHFPALLPGHQLRFHKRGRDGSGKCNVWRTDNPEDRVFGMLYRILTAEKPILDNIEGVGKGYRVESFPVHCLDGQQRQASFYYVAEAEHIDDNLKPFSWYHEFVVSGARHHGLPADYIEHLSAVSARMDHDSERHHFHQRILLDPA